MCQKCPSNKIKCKFIPGDSFFLFFVIAEIFSHKNVVGDTMKYD